MENQPVDSDSPIVVCRNPEFSEPTPEIVDGISRFIGNHFLLIHPITGHTNVITIERFNEVAGANETNKQVDEPTFDKIVEASINPDLN